MKAANSVSSTQFTTISTAPCRGNLNFWRFAVQVRVLGRFKRIFININSFTDSLSATGSLRQTFEV